MLDLDYKPMFVYNKEFLSSIEGNRVSFRIALERGEGEVKVYETFIAKSGREKENLRFVERIVKFMLWAFGGYKFYIDGNKELVEELGRIYSTKGVRKFDYDFMSKVYNRPLEFEWVEGKNFPKEQEKPISASKEHRGYRIGFDAGGSDRKVTATIDGEVVFDSEDVWFPKINEDPDYHLAGIRDSIDRAKEALGGRVDAIGVSTAGIVVDNEIRVASLFIKVPANLYAEKVVPIYKNLADTYKCPVKVANDGDVAALAGAFSQNKGKMLGIAMGTSEAAGFIDEEFRIKGYLNELAFAPVDINPDSAIDDWSQDVGVGSQYHSQDAVIRLAKEAKIYLDEKKSPAEKLIVVQDLAEKGDMRAIAVFEKLGEYFAYSILWYREFYPIDSVLLLGRVASGSGGDILIHETKRILKTERAEIEIVIPDEKTRRLGQSYTATLL